MEQIEEEEELKKNPHTILDIVSLIHRFNSFVFFFFFYISDTGIMSSGDSSLEGNGSGGGN